MPDNDHALSELEKLVAQAEAEAEAVPTPQPSIKPDELVLEDVSVLGVSVSDRPKPCTGHSGRSLKTCPTCKWPFCEECASALDPDCCHLCLDEPGADLVATPLTRADGDGVIHHGKLLTPGPTFGTMCERISKMSDYELEAHIHHYKELIKQAERSLDFRRVVLGTGQLESSQRDDAKRRALRGIKMPKAATAATAAGTKPATTGQRAANAAQMLKMLEALQQLQKQKVKP